MTPLSTRSDVINFVADLANQPDPWQPLVAPMPTIGDAQKFRQRLYAWRRPLRQTLAEPGTPDAQALLEWGRTAIGPRFGKEWLDYLIFRTREATLTEPPALVGMLQRPLYGPAPTFNAEEPAQ